MDQTEIPASQPVEVSSFMSRAANVFMAPGELYTEIAAAPVQNSSWVIPMIIGILVGLLMTIAIGTNQTLRDQVMQPKLDEMQKDVADGKMTEQQADQAEQYMTSPTMFLAFGSIGVLAIVVIMVHVIPLLLLAVGKFVFHASVSYKKYREAYGITMLIGSLGGVVSLLMMISMESMHAQPSAAFFIKDSFDPKNFAHNALASVNIFTIWAVAVTGLGLAKLCKKPTATGMAVMFGLWIAWVVLSSAMGWGAK